MVFHPLLPGPGPRLVGERLRLSVYRVGQLLDRRRLQFGLSRDLISRLGWSAGDRLVISIGVGADLGKVRVQRVDRSRLGHKLARIGTSQVLRVEVNTPVHVMGFDLSPVLDSFLAPACVTFNAEHGALTLDLTLPAAAEGAAGAGA